MLGFGIDEFAVRLVAGILIGFCIGLTGVGGGVLVVPALTLLFRLPASVAVGTASLYAFLTKVAATMAHYRLKTVATRTALAFLAGAIPASLAAAGIITHTVRRLGHASQAVMQFQAHLRVFIACVILFACALFALDMLWELRTRVSAGHVSRLARAVTRTATRKWVVCAALGAIVGALVGATSVGGGVMIIPMLIFFLGMTPSQTVGTSMLIAGVLTLLTSTVYFFGGQIDLDTAIAMAMGSFIGVPFGSRLSVRLPQLTLRGILLAVIVIAAVMMLTGNAGH